MNSLRKGYEYVCLKLGKRGGKVSNIVSRGMFPVRCQRDWFSVSSYLTLSLMAWKKKIAYFVDGI